MITKKKLISLLNNLLNKSRTYTGLEVYELITSNLTVPKIPKSNFETIFKEKNTVELSKLTQKRLFNYYKAEKKRFYKWVSKYKFSDSELYLWDVFETKETLDIFNNEYLVWSNYLKNIKKNINIQSK